MFVYDDEFVIARDDGSRVKTESVRRRRSHVLRATGTTARACMCVGEPPYLIWLPSPL